VRSQARKQVGNRTARSAAKTAVARARRDVLGGAAEADAHVTEAVSILDRAGAKGILHPRNAARRKARLMRLQHRRSAASSSSPG